LTRNNGTFNKSDLDDYLGILELLAIYIDNGVLHKNTVKEMFGFYIRTTWTNSEIQDYINSIKESEKTDKYYKQFKKLAIDLINDHNSGK